MPGLKKEPVILHFFCESCGAEVPRNAESCPKCGKRFASVLCPSCGFSGGEALFRSGCPACGYSSSGAGVSRPPAALKDFPDSGKPAGALPLWVYILTAAAFTGIAAVLFFSVLD